MYVVVVAVLFLLVVVAVLVVAAEAAAVFSSCSITLVIATTVKHMTRDFWQDWPATGVHRSRAVVPFGRGRLPLLKNHLCYDVYVGLFTQISL